MEDASDTLDESYSEDDFVHDDDNLEEVSVGEESQNDVDSCDEIEEESTSIHDDSSLIFSKHLSSVYCVDINPNDQHQIVTGSGDDCGMIWRFAFDGKIGDVTVLGGHNDTVCDVKFSFDGSLVATASFDGCVKIWDVKNGAEVSCLEGTDDVEFITWHSKGNIILGGGKNGTVWMWLAVTGECMKVFSGHDGLVTCGTFSSNGRLVVTGGEDCSVRLWAPKTGECRHAFLGNGFHKSPISCLATHPDSEHWFLIIVGSLDGCSTIVHLQSKKVVANFQHSDAKKSDAEPDSVEAVGFCPDKSWCATGGTDGLLKVWDYKSSICRISCIHPASVTKLQWTVSATVFTSCADGVIRVWDILNGTCLRNFCGHTNSINDFKLKWNSSGEQSEVDWLISVSDDATARVFLISDVRSADASRGNAQQMEL